MTGRKIVHVYIIIFSIDNYKSPIDFLVSFSILSVFICVYQFIILIIIYIEWLIRKLIYFFYIDCKIKLILDLHISRNCKLY